MRAVIVLIILVMLGSGQPMAEYSFWTGLVWLLVVVPVGLCSSAILYSISQYNHRN